MFNRHHVGVLLVAAVMVMGTASGGAFVGLQPDDPTAGPTPDVDEGDRQVDYDRGAYQLTLTPATNDSIDYELVIFGAAEPANDTASDVECIDELCTLDGDLEDGDTAAYNVSGAILSVTPETDLDVSIEGTFDGDAAVGVGWGQINVTDPSEDVDDDLRDIADAVGDAKEKPPVDDPVDTDPGEEPVADPPADPDPEWDLSFEECTVVTISTDSDDEYEYEVDTVFLDDDGGEDTFTISDSGSGATTVDTAEHDTGANATDAMIRSVNVRDADGDIVLAEDHPDWDDCEERMYEQWENGDNGVITDSEIIVGVLNVSDINVDVGDNHDDEYITLENTANKPIDLSGWEVRDREDGGLVSAGTILPFEFDDGFTLDSGEEVTIWTGEGSDDGENLYWGYNRNIWNQDGDTIIVEVPEGNQFTYEYNSGGPPDNGNGDENGEEDPNGDERVPADAFSFEWENCHTVHINVDDEYEDGGDWEVWEVTTSFYAAGDGYDTMVLETGDQLPATVDANEHIDEAVTDVHIRHIMVAIDDPDEFEVVGESNPGGDECGEQVQQQWEEYQNGGDEENGDQENGDEDANGDDEVTGEANGDEGNGDEEANGEANGDDENGDEEANGEANGDDTNGDEEANGETDGEDEAVENGDDDSDDQAAVGLIGNLGTGLLFAAYTLSILAFTGVLARGFWRGGDDPITG